MDNKDRPANSTRGNLSKDYTGMTKREAVASCIMGCLCQGTTYDLSTGVGRKQAAKRAIQCADVLLEELNGSG